LLKKYNVEIRTVENEGAIRYNLKYWIIFEKNGKII
jgi:hypothetical protein